MAAAAAADGKQRQVVDTVKDLKGMFSSLKKFGRRTVPFGAYDPKAKQSTDEVYLREMNISSAGLGCAAWDAAVILARWIHAHPPVFVAKRAHEMGAGVGLPGIMAGRYAKRVVLSDHLQVLIDNLMYNVSLNTNADADVFIPAAAAAPPAPAVAAPVAPAAGAGAAAARAAAAAPAVVASVGDAGKTREEIERRVVAERKNLAAAACAVVLDYTACSRDAKAPLEPCDVVVASELVYTHNIEYITAVVDVLQRLLPADGGGCFYMIQSDDRAGRADLVRLMTAAGFEAHIKPVGPKWAGNYGSKQRAESYEFFTFRRPNSAFPVME